MRKVILFLAVLCVSLCTFVSGSKAEISIKDYMNYEFLGKQGYSNAMIELVEMNKAKTFGEVIPSNLPSNPWKRAYRKLIFYIDPAEDYDTFGRRDIPMRPEPLEIY